MPVTLALGRGSSREEAFIHLQVQDQPIYYVAAPYLKNTKWASKMLSR